MAKSIEDRYDIKVEMLRDDVIMDSIFMSMIQSLDAALEPRYTSPRGTDGDEKDRK